MAAGATTGHNAIQSLSRFEVKGFGMDGTAKAREDVPIANGVACELPASSPLAGDWERVADNGLEHQAVRSRREAVADAKFDVDCIHLEIGTAYNC